MKPVYVTVYVNIFERRRIIGAHINMYRSYTQFVSDPSEGDKENKMSSRCVVPWGHGHDPVLVFGILDFVYV